MTETDLYNGGSETQRLEIWSSTGHLVSSLSNTNFTPSQSLTMSTVADAYGTTMDLLNGSFISSSYTNVGVSSDNGCETHATLNAQIDYTSSITSSSTWMTDTGTSVTLGPTANTSNGGDNASLHVTWFGTLS